MKRPVFFLCLFALGAAPADARDALGMFGAWGAFRDAGIPRCYAIAMPEAGARREVDPYADVGLWPKKGVRGQVHFRLSRRIQPGAAVQLTLAGQRYRLIGGPCADGGRHRGGDALGRDHDRFIARRRGAIVQRPIYAARRGHGD